MDKIKIHQDNLSLAKEVPTDCNKSMDWPSVSLKTLWKIWHCHFMKKAVIQGATDITLLTRWGQNAILLIFYPVWSIQRILCNLQRPIVLYAWRELQSITYMVIGRSAMMSCFTLQSSCLTCVPSVPYNDVRKGVVFYAKLLNRSLVLFPPTIGMKWEIQCIPSLSSKKGQKCQTEWKQ